MEVGRNIKDVVAEYGCAANLNSDNNFIRRESCMIYLFQIVLNSTSQKT